MKEARGLFVLLLAAGFAMVGIASAAQGYAVGSQTICTQSNTTFIACYDGAPLNFTFQISAPYAVGYGPYIAYAVDNSNVSEPASLFGGVCSIPGGQTVECMVTLNPMPLSSGNGIVVKTIRLKLQSQPYPQLFFNRSVNVTVYHYLTRNQSIFLDKYQSTFSQYVSENDTYSYFCSSYGICQNNIGYGISVAGAYLGLAAQNVQEDSIGSAMSNATIANDTLQAMEGQYLLFINKSNTVINNIIKGHYLLASAWNAFEPYSSKLYNCPTGNTTYGKNIFTQIGNAENYPMQTTTSGSYRYIQTVDNISVYTSNAIQKCAGIKTTNTTGTGGFLPGLSNTDKYAIVGIIIAAIVAAYLILRFKNSKEVEAIRREIEDRAEEMHNEKKNKKATEASAPEGKENEGELPPPNIGGPMGGDIGDGGLGGSNVLTPD